MVKTLTQSVLLLLAQGLKHGLSRPVVPCTVVQVQTRSSICSSHTVSCTEMLFMNQIHSLVNVKKKISDERFLKQSLYIENHFILLFAVCMYRENRLPGTVSCSLTLASQSFFFDLSENSARNYTEMVRKV